MLYFLSAHVVFFICFLIVANLCAWIRSQSLNDAVVISRDNTKTIIAVIDETMDYIGLRLSLHLWETDGKILRNYSLSSLPCFLDALSLISRCNLNGITVFKVKRFFVYPTKNESYVILACLNLYPDIYSYMKLCQHAFD